MKNIFLVLFLLFSVKGFGQESSNNQSSAITDKFTNDIFYGIYTSAVVPKNSWQLDTELVYRWENSENFKYRAGSLPDLKFRYGLFENFEFRFGSRLGYGKYRSVFLVEERWEVFSDYLIIGGKYNFLIYNENKGKLSVIAESYVPIFRSDEVLSDHFLPTLAIINSNMLTYKIGYIINFGASFTFNDRNSPNNSPVYFPVFYNLSLTPTVKIAKPLSFFLGTNVLQDQDFGSSINFRYHTGLLYNPVPDLQLKLSASYFSVGHRKYGFHSTNTNFGLAWRIN